MLLFVSFHVSNERCGVFCAIMLKAGMHRRGNSPCAPGWQVLSREDEAIRWWILRATDHHELQRRSRVFFSSLTTQTSHVSFPTPVPFSAVLKHSNGRIVHVLGCHSCPRNQPADGIASLVPPSPLMKEPRPRSYACIRRNI